jgi:hypothetical protein
MKVSPANTIPFLTRETTKIYYVDLSDLDFYVPEYRNDLFTHYQELASTGMEKVKNDLKNI